MDAAQVIDSLTRALAQNGEDITLRRQTAANPQTFSDVTVRASVREFRPNELIGGIIQGDRKVILANEEIAAATWPGPPRKNDRAVIGGVTFNVEGCSTIRLNGTIVRHELVVRG